MERELESKIFNIEDYDNKESMEIHIKEYIKKIKEEYPYSVVTREFFNGRNILVRATQITFNERNVKKEKERQEELEKQEVRIKEKGINGIGENVERNRNNGRLRGNGHGGGSERERGGR